MTQSTGVATRQNHTERRREYVVRGKQEGWGGRHGVRHDGRAARNLESRCRKIETAMAMQRKRPPAGALNACGPVPCDQLKVPNSQSTRMIGSGIPISQSNSPLPITRSPSKEFSSATTLVVCVGSIRWPWAAEFYLP